MSLQFLALSRSYFCFFLLCGVSGNFVIAFSGILIVEELVIDGKSMLSIEIINSGFSRHRARVFTQKSYVGKIRVSKKKEKKVGSLPEIKKSICVTIDNNLFYF